MRILADGFECQKVSTQKSAKIPSPYLQKVQTSFRSKPYVYGGRTRLLEDVIPALDITTTEMARHLGFARETFSRILHGHAPVSPDLAVRLERAGVSTAHIWNFIGI